jgi:glutamine amidotransferase
VAASPNVIVFDYGFGNVRSAQHSLQRLGVGAEISTDVVAASQADGLIVPGVGAFAACMTGLEAAGGPELIRARLAAERPVFGICVGMQVLFECGDEHGQAVSGLGIWPGSVTRLDSPVLPHMGWNTVEAPTSSKLFSGVASERFYFVHSYAARSWQSDGSQPGTAVTSCDYGGSFVAAVEQGPLTATQFHPEKSGDAGMGLIKNWIELLQ